MEERLQKILARGIRLPPGLRRIDRQRTRDRQWAVGHPGDESQSPKRQDHRQRKAG